MEDTETVLTLLHSYPKKLVRYMIYSGFIPMDKASEALIKSYEINNYWLNYRQTSLSKDNVRLYESNGKLMKKINELEDKVNSDNVVVFSPKLITGGKDGGNENWLGNVKIGTTFTARDRNAATREVGLGCYSLVFQGSRTSVLIVHIPSGEKTTAYVDTLRFSRQMEFIETLGIQEDEQPTEQKQE